VHKNPHLLKHGCGFSAWSKMMKITQAFHDKMVTYLMYASHGDLILNREGNLCTRIQSTPNFSNLPFDNHTPGEVLAIIAPWGWTLSMSGAEYLLENCTLSNRNDIKKLDAIARGDVQ
jgi:hypothetical protein